MIENKFSKISLTCINDKIESTSKSIIETLNSFSVNKCQVLDHKKDGLFSIELFPLEYNPKVIKMD